MKVLNVGFTIVCLFSCILISNPEAFGLHQEFTSNDLQYELIVTNNKVSLPDALVSLSEKYDVYFSYDIKELEGYEIQASFLNGSDFKTIIKSICSVHNLKYERVGKNNYVIFKNQEILSQHLSDLGSLPKIQLNHKNPRQEITTATLNTLDLPSASPSYEVQQVFINGTIIDEIGQPMIGVAISIKENPTVGTISDIDGKWSLEVPTGNETLMFSYLGYKTLEINIEGNKEINVQLEPNLQTLDEVVVVGFGTQKKRYTTGAISKIDSDELLNSTQTTVESSLQGKIAGVMVTTSDAMAGSPVSVRIRGTSSIVASSEPLYVVDGVPVVSGNFSHNDASSWRLATAHESNALAQLNPNDIESIEVLKDASAAAIYGSRGANGVVLITTKRGKEGKTKYDVSLHNGFSQETNRIEMLNGSQYLKPC